MSRITTAPRSVERRISLPKPCLRRSAACGSASCPNGSRTCSARAAYTGSVGTGNGSRTMITQLSRSPGMSMPSQKLEVPSSSGRFASSNVLSSCRRWPSMPWPRMSTSSRSTRCLSAVCTSRSWRWEVNRTRVRPPTRRATAATRSSTATSNNSCSGGGRSVGRHTNAW